MPDPRIREAHIGELTPDQHNANKGTERGDGMLEESLRRYGAGRSILLDKHGRIIAGNKTANKAGEIGLEDVLVVETDGTQLVAVQRTDLDLDDPEARALAFADNRIAEVDLAWDAAAIAAALNDGVNLDALWKPDEIADMLEALQEELETNNDDPPIPPNVATRAHVGEIWALGDHKLAVGDCRDFALVERLFDGKRCRLVWTDPPYGVDYSDKERLLWKSGHRTTLHTEIANDALTEEQTEELCCDGLKAALAHALPGVALYVASPSGPLLKHFIAAIDRSGFTFKHLLVWVKNHFAMGRSDYHYRHECVLYGWREDGGHYFTPSRGEDSVFEYDKPSVSVEHPTMKPIGLVQEQVVNSTRTGDIVFDPFCGSGTTLLACERTKRVGLGIELMPHYADVILARWEAETGREATLLVPAAE